MKIFYLFKSTYCIEYLKVHHMHSFLLIKVAGNYSCQMNAVVPKVQYFTLEYIIVYINNI